MTSVKLAGVAVEKMSNEIAKTLPDEGKFEFSYLCPPDKIKLEVREKLGQKFLDWPLS
jgi:hypothetical protein